MSIDLATLALKIERVQVDAATSSLDKFTKAAEQAEGTGTKVARAWKPAAGSVAGDLARLEQTAARSVPGLGKVDAALRAIASQSIGLTGEMGRLGSALSMLGGGGPQVTGMLVAAGLLGLALQKMGEDAKRTAEELKGVRDELGKLIQTAAGLAQWQKGTLSMAQTAREAELTYRYALLEAAVRADNATVVLKQQERIAELLNEQAKDTVLFGQAQKVIDAAHAAAAEKVTAAGTRVADEAERYARALRDAMASAAKIPAELAKSVSELIKAGEAADRWKLSFTDGRKELERLGLVSKPGDTFGGRTGDDVLNAEIQATEARMREAGDLIDTTFRKISLTEKHLIRELQSDFADLFATLLTDGLQSFERLFGAIRQGFLKVIADLAAQKLMAKLAGSGVREIDPLGEGALTGGGKLSPAAAAGTLGVAYAIGATLTKTLEGLLSAGSLARQAAEEAARAWQQTIDDVNIGLMAPGLEKALAQSGARFAKLVDEAIRLNPLDFDHLYESAKKQQAAIDQVTAAGEQEAEQIRAEFARRRQEFGEDLEVRRLRAQGLDAEADAMAFANVQHREYEQAVRDGATAVELATLVEVQAAEDFRRQVNLVIAAREKELDVAQAALEQTTQTVRTLRDFATQLRGAGGSPVQNLDFARSRFETTAALARAGDQDAARLLPQLGQQLLDLSRQYSASGMGYQTDLTYVLDVVDSLGDQFDVQRNLQQIEVDTLQAMLEELRQTNLTWLEFLRLSGTFIHPPIPWDGQSSAPASGSAAGGERMAELVLEAAKAIVAAIHEQTPLIADQTTMIRRQGEAKTLTV